MQTCKVSTARTHKTHKKGGIDGSLCLTIIIWLIHEKLSSAWGKKYGLVEANYSIARWRLHEAMTSPMEQNLSRALSCNKIWWLGALLGLVLGLEVQRTDAALRAICANNWESKDTGTQKMGHAKHHNHGGIEVNSWRKACNVCMTFGWMKTTCVPTRRK